MTSSIDSYLNTIMGGSSSGWSGSGWSGSGGSTWTRTGTGTPWPGSESGSGSNSGNPDVKRYYPKTPYEQRHGSSRGSWSDHSSGSGGSGSGSGSGSGGSAIPAGFSSSQWKLLQSMANNNPTLAALMKQYTTTPTTPSTPDWRRQLPTDTSQLLRQLAFNAGEMGMPGGYVGAVQLPAYGTNLPSINNPDMSTYGQAPGYGEATFYQQSMKGGMTPIAAMSPLGVPEGWNPGASEPKTLKQQLEEYLAKIGSNSSKSGGGQSYSPSSSYDVRSLFRTLVGDPRTSDAYDGTTASAMDAILKKLGGTSSTSTSTTPPATLPPTSGGTPIPLPYGTTP